MFSSLSDRISSHSYPITVGWWALALLAALCIGVSKAGFSGVSLVTVAIMASIMPAKESTGVVLPLLLFADVFAVRSFRQYAKWEEIAKVLPAAALGVVAGAFLMLAFEDRYNQPDESFKRLLGAIIGGLALLQAARLYRPEWFRAIPAGQVMADALGGLTGVTTMLANGAGPVVAVYLLAVKLPKYELVGTSAWIFLLLNAIKVPFSCALGLIRLDSLLLNVILAPAVVVGVFAGRRLLAVVPQKLFEWLILLFALLAAGRLLFWR